MTEELSARIHGSAHSGKVLRKLPPGIRPSRADVIASGLRSIA